jgi:hypothetical protein
MNRKELTEQERSFLFHIKGYDYRMNKWTRQEQWDKSGIPKYRDELTEDDKSNLEVMKIINKDENN